MKKAATIVLVLGLLTLGGLVATPSATASPCQPGPFYYEETIGPLTVSWAGGRCVGAHYDQDWRP